MFLMKTNQKSRNIEEKTLPTRYFVFNGKLKNNRNNEKQHHFRLVLIFFYESKLRITEIIKDKTTSDTLFFR